MGGAAVGGDRVGVVREGGRRGVDGGIEGCVDAVSLCLRRLICMARL